VRYGVWGKPVRYGVRGMGYGENRYGIKYEVRGAGKTGTVWGMRYGVWGKQLFKTGFFSVLNKFSKLC
jgi:hypothetical protein